MSEAPSDQSNHHLRQFIGVMGLASLSVLGASHELPATTQVTSSHSAIALPDSNPDQMTVSLVPAPTESPTTTTQTPTPPPETAPAPQTTEQLEQLTVPEQVSQFMTENVVTLPMLNNCSGLLLRAPDGTAIGGISAQHGGLLTSGSDSRGYNNTLGNDGRYYTVTDNTDQNRQVLYGRQQTALQSAGLINQLYQPGVNDKTRDLTLFSLPGHTMNEVRTAYQTEQLPAAAIQSMKTGDTMYVAGWPVDQPNPSKPEQQQLGLSVLGTGSVLTEAGQRLNVLWTALPKPAGGVNFAKGMSGGVGLSVVDGQVRAVGELGVYIDLSASSSEDTTAERKSYEQIYHVNLDNVSTLYGFTWQVPSETSAGLLSQVVDSPAALPTTPLVVQAEVAAAKKQFSDSHLPQIAVNGYAEIPYAGRDVNSPEWLENPLVAYDSKTGNLIFGWRQNGDIQTKVLTADSLPSVTIYASDGSAQSVASVGQTVVTAEPTNGNGFTGTNGKNLGQEVAAGPAGAASYQLVAENGQLTLVQRSVAATQSRTISGPVS